MSLPIQIKQSSNAVESFLPMAVLNIGHMLHVATRFGPHRLAASPQPGMCQPALMHCPRRRQPATSRRIASDRIVASVAAHLSAAGGADSQQSYSLSLSVADPVKATGLVHRCLVTEAQNMRRVSSPALDSHIIDALSCYRRHPGLSGIAAQYGVRHACMQLLATSAMHTFACAGHEQHAYQV